MTAITLATNIRAEQKIEVYKARTEERIFFGTASDFAHITLEKYLYFTVSDIFTLPSEDIIYIEIDWRMKP